MGIETQGILKKGMGRRSFVKGMAATLGMAAVGTAVGCAPQGLQETESGTAPTYVEDEIFQGCCHARCGGDARFNVHVRDGKIVKTSFIKSEMDPELDHICARGLSHAQMTYSPERVQYPMRRVDGTERGAGEWERITWDEAIDEIVTKWQGYIEEFGPESIGFVYGSGSSLNTQYAYMRLLNAFGGTQWAEFDCMASLNVGKDVFGRNLFLVGNDFFDMLNSKYIWIWGSNASEARFQHMRTLWAAKDAGAKIICIDPLYADIATKADMYVPIRPASDGALAMAMTRIFFEEGLTDDDYLAKNSVAPFLVAQNGYQFLHAEDIGLTLDAGVEQEEGDGLTIANTDDAAEDAGGPKDEFGRPTNYIVFDAAGNVGSIAQIENPELLGSIEINGVVYKTAFQMLRERCEEWTTDRAAEVTGIPAETIVELAHMYAEGPSHLWLGFGPDRYCNGGVATLCIYAMIIACGQVGKPGSGVGGQNGGNGVFRPNGVRTDFLATWFPPNAVPGLMNQTPALPETVETGMMYGKPHTVKSLISYINNHVSTSPDRNLMLKTMEKIDLLICVDAFMTETAQHSDIILPNPYWFEYEYITGNHKFNDKAIEPLFETKTDVEIMALLGQAMGFEGFDLDDASFTQMYYDNDYCKENGWNWDYIKENKVVENQGDRAPFIYGNVEYGTVWTNTPGRAAFFLENPLNYFDATKPIDLPLVALPHWKSPNEAWAQTVGGIEKNPLADQYPLTIMSTHYKLKAHTLYSKCPQLLEIKPEPVLQISPTDAEARGIREDDYVRIFNDRGEFIALAKIDPGCQPGVLRTEHGWWLDQHTEPKGKINSITSVAVDHQWPTLEHFDLLCQVERYNG